MTGERLRELLEERVSDTTTVDLASTAWDRASTARHRRRSILGAVVAVVAIVGATTVVVSGRGDEPAPANSSKEASASSRAERAGSYGGVPVWWAPPAPQEADLPTLADSTLPADIDLSAGAGPIPVGMRVVGLFQFEEPSPARVVAVGVDGESYSLDVGRLEPLQVDGEARAQATPHSVSRDGRYAFFVQPRSLEVYDFELGTWSTVPTGVVRRDGVDWSLDSSSIRVYAPTGEIGFDIYEPTGALIGNTTSTWLLAPLRSGDDGYGPIRFAPGALPGHSVSGARSSLLGGPVADVDGESQNLVDAIVVDNATPYPSQDGSEAPATEGALLALPRGTRPGCCPVVGWHDDRTVLFESREDGRVLAWRVGTPEMFRVSDIRGWTPGEETYIASFADVAP